jgi:hypothetical protein
LRRLLHLPLQLLDLVVQCAGALLRPAAPAAAARCAASSIVVVTSMGF